MSKKAIDLADLIRIKRRQIRKDKPIIKFIDDKDNEFFTFLDSGLNVLIAKARKSKTL